jgi:hypothetical protein
MKKNIYWLCCLVAAACSQPTSKEAIKKEDTSLRTPAPAVVNPADNIPLYRDSLQAEPVAEYKERTENPLNDWYFAVKLYETPKTFHYRIHLQYEEIEGDDTLKLPNFGTMPEPVIEKGADKYSCIIGFKDKEGQVREYKKVYVKDGALKITALKHYAVATYEK